MPENTRDGNKDKQKDVPCYRFKDTTRELHTDSSCFYGAMKINSAIAGRTPSPLRHSQRTVRERCDKSTTIQVI